MNRRQPLPISIIGSGHVGLVTGACFAELGHRVMCVDNDLEKLASLQAGRVPFYEPGLQPMVATHAAEGRLLFSSDIGQAVQHGIIIFICVGTPPRPDGGVDLSHIEAVSRELARHITDYRLVVEKSTVPVRTGEWVYRTIAENVAAGMEFDVASNPEFLREGTAVRDFLHPDRVVIGTSSQRAASLLVQLYEPLNAPLLLTDINSAELIKHAANAFLAMKISFINAVAQVCSLSGADVKKVARGLGLDRRIGMDFLQAGIGFGGMCLPKDLLAFIQISRELGYPFELLEAVQRINAEQRRWPLLRLQEALGELTGRRIAVLGLAFKPDTDDLRFAPALDVVASLQAAGAQVRAYDPQAMEEARALLPQVTMCR
ncbi:MAG TPA: UDP-glucose/GDP-mannose dehydrogenase family protein, partial [Candidatus Nitrosotenuis sp.]|nr:UDP-glucose/GDP-mannose dehydrogenase family protein [Candidatus Nitrosotenuis sp.]